MRCLSCPGAVAPPALRRRRDAPRVAAARRRRSAAAVNVTLGSLPQQLADATTAVEGLRALALNAARSEFAQAIAAAHPSMRASAANLAHYLALRRVDQRPLQMQLQSLGLSSLGNMETNVLPHLDAVLAALRALSGSAPMSADVPTHATSKLPALLQHHARAVLGPLPRLGTRVMVTLPSDAAMDPAVADGYLRGGMSLARINCAHDSAEAWRAMAAHVRAAEARQGRKALLTFDLPGPKMRVGPIEPGPAVVRIKPARDQLGRPVAAAAVVLHCEGSPPPAAADAAIPSAVAPVALPLDGGGDALLAAARVGDSIVVRSDARARRRVFRVALVRPLRFVVACSDATTYFVPGTKLALKPWRRRQRRGGGHGSAVARVAQTLPRPPGALRLGAGDLLRVRRGDDVARAVPGGAALALPVPRLFACVRPGHRLLLDDGKLAGVVADVARDGEAFTVRLTHAAAGPGRTASLRQHNGLNAPDSNLDAPALDDEDRASLAHVLPLRPDAISLSFVQRAEDVLAAHEALRAHPHVALILKIETAAAFERLPELLFAGMRRPGLALMLARGDLGPEVGWARLSEVQEEVMMLAEAAHAPLVYATQVLESMIRTGVPSRAEVTDAASAARAEATMLNKGPFVERAMALLQDICTRLAGHQHKRMHLLRRLRCAAGASAGGQDADDASAV